MASSWGLSFGKSWGNSWGGIAGEILSGGGPGNAAKREAEEKRKRSAKYFADIIRAQWEAKALEDERKALEQAEKERIAQELTKKRQIESIKNKKTSINKINALTNRIAERESDVVFAMAIMMLEDE